ncbi:TPR repeat-containing protein [Paenibacillus sp. yr247]|uniref:tetratricopeptide repeat protein n=1 Tax=Paenibacillus sp. yr247 TaxID=1761880 RepID=UPI00088044E5|nr:tetratricopeptide repeat protein [Paenibacillus sp. yr247]SDP30143.1 TPR repeat-containing protein [Paenibacillus sp. yr247]
MFKKSESQTNTKERIFEIENIIKSELFSMSANIDKKEVCAKIIKACDGIEDPMGYYYQAIAYKWLGAKFRQEVILKNNKFLENPKFTFDPNRKTYKSGGVVVTQVDILFEIYKDLGEAFEGEYLFEESLAAYKKSLDLNESIPSIYCNLAQVYSKMNKLEESINILEQGKRSKYYEIKHFKTPLGDAVKDDTFVIVIDKHLREYKDKLAKGYIYKPRKRRV